MTDHQSRPSDEYVPRPTLEDLDRDTCFELIASVPVGRAAFTSEDGVMHLLPVNHLFHEGEVVFRTAAGTKLDVVQRHAGIEFVFEADEYDREDHSGWSVIVRGPAEPILDTIRIAHLDRTGHVAWTNEVERSEWVKIVPHEVTGRRIVNPD